MRNLYHVDILRPKCFDGSRSARKLETFLLGLEQFAPEDLATAIEIVELLSGLTKDNVLPIPEEEGNCDASGG